MVRAAESGVALAHLVSAFYLHLPDRALPRFPLSYNASGLPRIPADLFLHPFLPNGLYFCNPFILNMVEVRRFELLTFSLRTRRSTN